jgi:hypothetical protein
MALTDPYTTRNVCVMAFCKPYADAVRREMRRQWKVATGTQYATVWNKKDVVVVGNTTYHFHQFSGRYLKAAHYDVLAIDSAHQLQTVKAFCAVLKNIRQRPHYPVIMSMDAGPLSRALIPSASVVEYGRARLIRAEPDAPSYDIAMMCEKFEELSTSPVTLSMWWARDAEGDCRMQL